jgi:large subunit ribosomal protein L3
MKMPGQHGNRKVTIQNIEVVDVKEDQNLLLLKGGIPGSPMGWVLIRSATKSEATRTEKKGSVAPSA